MRIINPIDLTEPGVVGSNAPGDEFQIWSPDGRLNSFPSNNLVSVGGNLAFYAPLSFSNKTISVYSLSSGEVESSITDAAIRYIGEVSASPDGIFVAYAYVLDSGDSGVKVYDTSSSQIVYNRVAEGSNGFISWAPNSSSFIYHDQSLSFGDKFLLCIKAESSSWGAPVASSNLLDESGLSVSSIVSLSARTPRLSDSGALFVTYRATESQAAGGGAAVVVSRISTAMAVTHTQLMSTEIFPQGLLANEVRSEVAVIHSGAGASFFSYADLTQIGTPETISGTSYKGLSVSLDGAEFTLQSASVQPYNRTFSLTDYSELTAKPATGDYSGIYYAEDYFLGVNADGTYDIVELATNTPITQTNPTVTAGDIYTYANHNYEALQDNNDRPDLGALADPPTWLDLGFINPLRMIDGKLDSLTVSEGDLTITVNPGGIVNGIALFNVTAATVRITVSSPDFGTVYDTGDLSSRDNSAVTGWYSYFFSPRPIKKDLARIDLPSFPGATITVTLSGGGAVSIGELVVGRVQVLGETRQGSGIGIIDSSTKERDEFGDFIIVERRSSKRAEYDVIIQRAATSGVHRTLDRHRTKPIVYIGDVEEEALTVYGFFIDFQINYESSCVSLATITVEGL